MRTLAHGTYGKIKEAQHCLTGESVAIKIIDKSRIESSEDSKLIKKESDIMRKLSHPNITKIYEVIETEKYFFLISEYAL